MSDEVEDLAGQLLELLDELGLIQRKDINGEPHITLLPRGLETCLGLLSYQWTIVEDRISHAESSEEAADYFEMQATFQSAIEATIELWHGMHEGSTGEEGNAI